jgi:hypothetical protein
MVGNPGEVVDPGWRPSLLWAVLPPNIAMWRANKNAAGVPFIVVHRGVFVSFLSSTFIYLVVLLFVLPINEYGSRNALVYTLGVHPPHLTAELRSRSVGRVAGVPCEAGQRLRCGLDLLGLER